MSQQQYRSDDAERTPAPFPVDFERPSSGEPQLQPAPSPTPQPTAPRTDFQFPQMPPEQIEPWATQGYAMAWDEQANLPAVQSAYPGVPLQYRQGPNVGWQPVEHPSTTGAFVMAIVSLFFPPLGVPALVWSMRIRGEVTRQPERYRPSGLLTASIVISMLGALLTTLIVVLILAALLFSI